MPSWNNIKGEILNLANRHAQVNSFGTGDPTQIGTDTVLNLKTPDRDRIAYPLVYADLESSQVINTSVQMSVALYFMDRVEPLRDKPSNVTNWQDNEDEVISDLHDIALDFVAYFTDDPNLDYTVEPQTSLNRFYEEERNGDAVVGWRVVLNFIGPFGRDICAIPQN